MLLPQQPVAVSRRASGTGSIGTPRRRTSKWRWGPVEMPVEPTSPTTCPAVTLSPTRLSTTLWCVYTVASDAPVFDDDAIAVAAAVAGDDHHSGRGGVDRGTSVGGEVQARVEADRPADGVDADAVRRGQARARDRQAEDAVDREGSGLAGLHRGEDRRDVVGAEVRIHDLGEEARSRPQAVGHGRLRPRGRPRVASLNARVWFARRASSSAAAGLGLDACALRRAPFRFEATFEHGERLDPRYGGAEPSACT